MNKMQRQVRAFMSQMDQVVGATPGIRDEELRIVLIEEEAKEFADAVREGDLVEAIDAICDILYVTFGAAVAFGIDIQPFFDAVHESNMQKGEGAVDPTTGKRLKPANWQEPDLESLLRVLLPPSEEVGNDGEAFRAKSAEKDGLSSSSRPYL